MRLYILLLLLLFLPSTYSQFSTCDIRGTTPTLPCNYCTLSPTITIGANSTYPPSPQTVNVAEYSTTARFGRFANSTQIATGPTAGPVIMGQTAPSPSPTQSFVLGDYASLFLMARYARNAVTVAENAPGGFAAAFGPNSGRVTIGISSSVANIQTSELGICSRYVNMGYGTPTCNSEFVDVGQVTRIPSPTPTPTRYYQYCRICEGSDEARFGDNAVVSKIASQPTSGPLTLGRTIGTGAPSLTDSNKVNMNGLYHYVYGSNCRPNSLSAFLKLVCFTGTNGAYYNGYVTNAALSSSVTPTAPPGPTGAPVGTFSPTPTRTVTSGYDVSNNEWHPPEPGFYLVTMSFYFTSSGGRGEIKVVQGGTLIEGAIAWGPTGAAGMGSTTLLTRFNSVGVNDYIYFIGNFMFIDLADPNWSAYQHRISIARVG